MPKTCFKCGKSKPLSEFYLHCMMADGHLNKCKACAKRDVKENYKKDPNARRLYEQARAQDPTRRANQLRYNSNRAKAFPGARRANTAVGNAIRSGKLVPDFCEVCGHHRVQAHHDDYRRPLAVRWLCFKHHKEHHGQVAFGIGDRFTRDVRKYRKQPC
jgi:hypothetical protein